jgi:hypothetical protein
MDSKDYVEIQVETFFQSYDSWRIQNNLSEDERLVEVFDNHIGLKFMDRMASDEGVYLFDIIDRDKWFLSKIKYGL